MLKWFVKLSLVVYLNFLQLFWLFIILFSFTRTRPRLSEPMGLGDIVSQVCLTCAYGFGSKYFFKNNNAQNGSCLGLCGMDVWPKNYA